MSFNRGMITIAALDTPDVWKADADVRCDGFSDNVDIAGVISDDLPTTLHGTVMLLPGTFNFGAPVQVTRSNVHIALSPGTICKAAANYTTSAISLDGGLVTAMLFLFGNASTAYTNVGITGPGGFSGALLDCNSLVATTCLRAIQFSGPLTNCFVRGFAVTGNQDVADLGSRTIEFRGITAVTNEIKYCRAEDIYMYDVAEGIQAFEAFGVMFRNNFIRNLGEYQDCLEFTSVRNGSMNGNYLEQPGGVGGGSGNSCIDLAGSGNLNIVLDGNTCVATSAAGLPAIVIVGNRVVASNNTLVGPFEEGFHVSGDDIVIDGNIATDFDEAADSRFVEGTSGGGNRWIISNNIVRNIGAEVIKPGAVAYTDVKIINNIFMNPCRRNTTNSFVNWSGSASCTRLELNGNTFLDDTGTPRGTWGITGVDNIDGFVCDGNTTDGNFQGSGRIINQLNDAQTRARFNQDFITERTEGSTATITAASTTVSVTHGVIETPSAGRIHVALTNQPTNDIGDVWVSGITATVFVINCRNVPGAATAIFSWAILPKFE